jgi:hypothetical protein
MKNANLEANAVPYVYLRTSTYDFPTYDPIELTSIDLCSEFLDLWFKTRISDLGQLLQKSKEPSDHSSGVFYQAESLPESPITRALLSELHEVLGMSYLHSMLTSLFIEFVNALVARIITLNVPW